MTDDEFNDLVWKMAARVKALADERLPVLRKIAEADVSCRTRGELIEWVLVAEFLKETFE